MLDLGGAEVLSSKNNRIDVANLPSGLYLLRIESEKKAPVIRKIIKK